MSAKELMKNAKHWRIIGLMSGTSMDGIDAVLTEIYQAEDLLELKILKHHTGQYPQDVTDKLQRLVLSSKHNTDLQEICCLNFEVGRAFARTAQELLAQLSPLSSVGKEAIHVDLIASHGQTVWHQPRPPGTKSTLQIGTPVQLAEETGLTVVHDFRTRDVSAGGQGAPLVSLLDTLLFRHSTRTRVLLNIGGIANVTYLPALNQPDLSPIAFDTGPGNALIDACLNIWTQGSHLFDEGGQIAAQGQVDVKFMDFMNTNKESAYFKLRPPKTTGKEEFGGELAQRIYDVYRIDPSRRNKSHFLATITAFTARTIVSAIKDHLPQPVDEIIASGGGTRNTTLMRMIQDFLPGVKVSSSDQYALPSQTKEALAFSVLGFHTMHGWAGNVPACTGAREGVILGSITPGKNYFELMKHVLHNESKQPQRAVMV